MKLNTLITPMNCAFGQGINSFCTFYENEFNLANVRSLLFYEPLVSKFSMKTGTGESFIEPCIYGLIGGDEVTITFKAKKRGNSPNSSIRIWQGEILDDFSTVYLDQVNFNFDVDETYYKEYRFPMIITKNNNNKIGDIFVIRCFGSGTELDIKDVNIQVETSNSNLKLENNLFVFNEKNDFLNVINQQVNSTDYDYTNTKKELGVGVNVIDNMMVVNSNTTANKNLAVKIPNKKYNRVITPVYIEYKKNGGEFRLGYTYKKGSVTVPKITTLEDSISEFKKKIVYLIANNDEDINSIYIEAGCPRIANYTIKEFIINDLRFCDWIDKNLYIKTNTNAFIKGIV